MLPPANARRFGPRAWLYVSSAAGLAAFAYALVSGEHWLLPIAMLAFLPGLPGWVWIRIDDEGLRRSGPFTAARRYSWSQLGGVIGRAVTARGGAGQALTAFLVLDARGQVLFTLSPWLSGRSELVRSISKHCRHDPEERRA